MNKYQIIAGPCSAETEDQVVATALLLASIGITEFRAGIWKPRSRANQFEGVGERGIPWLGRVQRELGMRVSTEVALPAHVEAVLKAGIDSVWVGARTTVNPFMIDELGRALRGTSIRVYLKNPVCPDIELWTGAVERLDHFSICDLALIQRGFFTYAKEKYRNSPCWPLAEEMRRRFPALPFYCDPSHMAGRREWIAELIEQSMTTDIGFDGLFIESHCAPQDALSDAQQQLTPADLDHLLQSFDLNR